MTVRRHHHRREVLFQLTRQCESCPKAWWKLRSSSTSSKRTTTRKSNHNRKTCRDRNSPNNVGQKSVRKGRGSQGKKRSETWEEKFAEKTSLRTAMEAAMNASLTLGDQETPKSATLGSRKRLQEKVETAGHHMMDLLNLVRKRASIARLCWTT